jgi:hypothetical protein
MSDPKQKEADYRIYAEQCLMLAAMLPDRESRVLAREMAAEWLNLADSLNGAEQYRTDRRLGSDA